MKNANKITGCFFDLDGTLVDTEPMWVTAIMSSLEEISCELSKPEADELIYGRSWLDIYDDLFQLFPGACPERLEFETQIEGHFKVIKQEGDFVIHSSVELLKKLSQKMPIAVVSGSTRDVVGDWISEMGLESYIQFHMGCEDYPNGKPDPICYQMAAERLGVSPESSLVFEDSTAGVKSAKSAGMYCVALSLVGGRQQDLEVADLILNDLADLDLNALNDTPPAIRKK